jgi:hypothetical protein
MKEAAPPKKVTQQTAAPAGLSEVSLFGAQLRQFSEGFFQGFKATGVSLTVTGQKTLTCQTDEVEIYSFDGDRSMEAIAQKTITGHAKNSDGNTECKIEFRFYALGEGGKEREVRKDTVARGDSTPSRTGRWTRVTAKCIDPPPVERPQCRLSWTVG